VRISWTAAAIAAFVAAFPARPADNPPSAMELARRVERWQATTRDLCAHFTQTYRSGVLGRQVVERGTLKIKRPGRMLWQYDFPEPKTFVADGKRFYFYLPKEHQVIVQAQDPERGVAARLLSGEAGLLAEFTVAFDTDSTRRLRLTPRAPDAEVETVILDVDASGRITAIEMTDAQGSVSRFLFQGFKENGGLPDSAFRFEVPRGVEVITG
jgi:outer membrane lipoprotein carrier protein